MKIVDFDSSLAEAFKRLNYEWLEKYFHIEDIDERILSNPQVEVIDHGGYILFAVEADTAIGTAALKHHGGGCFELTKMAVTAGQQGRGVGRALLHAAIARFDEIAGQKMFLESHSSLATAIKLYESAGFRHAPHPGGSDYARSDTYMIYQPS